MADFIGTDGNDELIGGSGNDTLDGGLGDDQLFGGAGDDTLLASRGFDIFDGGSGVDTLIADTSFATNSELDLEVFLDSESGYQAIRQFYTDSPTEDPGYDQILSIENYQFIGIFDLLVTGSEADNVITTDEGNDELIGGSGNDTLDGGLGDDTAFYSGVVTDYKISITEGVVKLLDNRGVDGEDTVSNVENFVFADGTLSLNELPTTGSGSSDGDETDGESPINVITGNEGSNDFIIGTPGIDKVIIDKPGNTVNIVAQDGLVVITSGGEVDELTDVERVQLSDISIAFDLDDSGNAAKTAKILGSVFGQGKGGEKQDPGFVGIGLSFLDRGTSYEELMELALSARGAQSNDDVVTILWENIVGSLPSDADKAPFVAQLDAGEQSWGSLGVFAAELELNESNINLAGLAQSGLEYVEVV